MKGKNPAKVNLKNIKSFIQGYKRMFTEEFGFLDQYIQEQVIWRSTKAADCVNAGHCLYCGCNMPGKLYSDIGCEDPEKKCYPEMMDINTWNQFKLDNNIQIKIE